MNVSVFADMRKSPNADETIKAIDIPEINEAHIEIMYVWQDSQEKQVRKPTQSLS